MLDAESPALMAPSGKVIKVAPAVVRISMVAVTAAG